MTTPILKPTATPGGFIVIFAKPYLSAKLRTSQIIDLLSIASLFFLILYGVIPTLRRSFWAWDEGNLYYPGYAWSRGQVPNIDFVHGYPGLYAWITSWTHAGPHFNILGAKYIGLIGVLATSLAIYIIARRFLLHLPSFLISTAPMARYFEWPSPNPGWLMSGVISIGIILLIKSTDKRPDISPRPAFWFSGLALIGISVGIKQAGIFAILGALQICVLFLSEKQKLKKFILFALVTFPFVAFITLRVRAQPIDVFLSAHLFTLFPWAYSIILLHKWINENESIPTFPKLNISFFIFSLITIAVSSSLWLFIYPDSINNAVDTIKEVWIRVPSLIDRDYQAAGLIKRIRELAHLLLVLLAPILINNKLATSRYKQICNKYIYGICILAPCLAFLYIFSNIYKTKIATPALFDAYLFIPIVITLIIPKILKISKASLVPAMAMLLLFSMTFIASSFPYAMNGHYAQLGTAIIIIFLVQLWLKKMSTPLLKGMSATLGSFGLLITLQTVAKNHSNPYPQVKESYYDKNIGYTFVESLIPLAKAAEWLRNNMQDNETIAGYPNYALAFALADKLSFGRWPNFLGNRNDYSELLSYLNRNDGPIYFIISPTLYPYEKNGNSYFLDPKEILTALHANYYVAFTINHTTGDKIDIYKKKHRGKVQY